MESPAAPPAAPSDGPGGDVQQEVLHLDLADDPRAPGQARRAVRETLTGWRLSPLVDSVVLAVSELVTNAIRYGRPPVYLVLRRKRQGVRLDVHDGDPREPDVGPAEDDAESGRGLGIVQAVADDVSCDQIAGDGKVVHASFEVGPQEQRGS
jgi:anti-sigma regulatory factor (Ser/Thr protein kinase)